MPEKIAGKLMLTLDEKRELEGMLPMLLEMEQEIKRAKRAGLEIGELEEQYRKAKALRDGLLREYT